MFWNLPPVKKFTMPMVSAALHILFVFFFTIPIACAAAFRPTIAAGSDHTVQVRADGTLWAWGNNNAGQLGDGTTINRALPVQIGTGYAQVAAGGAHTVAIKSDGSLWAWGANSFGQVGDGTTIYRNQPVQIGSGYAQVAAGYTYTVAVKTDGTLWAWGENNDGELGDGTTMQRDNPVQIGSGYAQVAAGRFHTVAIKRDGTLWVWGLNNAGQLGLGSSVTRQLSPVQVGEHYARVAAGDLHTVAIKTDGALWAWGWNEYGQLGSGSADSYSPIPVAIGSDYSAVTAGHGHTVAIKTDGTLWGWGDNYVGQVGDGSTTQRRVPVQIGSGYQQIAAGYLHTVALKNDGSLMGWGANYYGQLGDAYRVSDIVLSPTSIASGYSQLASGSNANHTIAIKPDGTLWSLGNNDSGQLGNGSVEALRNTLALIGSDYAQAAAGAMHTLAIKRDGSLWGWGSNAYGQMAFSAQILSLAPTPVQFPTMAAATPRLVNVSSRANTLTGDGVTIAGFVIAGGNKTVLITARGPSLTAAGVPNVLANPRLRLIDSSGKTLMSNDDWQSNSNAQDITATQGAPSDTKESALLATLAPGAYTAIMDSADSGTGNGLVAVDGVSNPSDSGMLVNLSTRAMVGVGDNVLIAGVIITDGPRKVLLTARGASLAAAGVAGTLADPMIELHDASGALVDQNDDASSAANYADIIASGKAPSEAHESAILRTLQPGAYTLVVRGKSASQGVCLVAVDLID